MRARVVSLLLLLPLVLGLGVAQAEDQRSAIAALIKAAQGRYPAASLPLMCVSVHQTGVSPEQNLSLMQAAGARCARSDNSWAAIEQPGEAGTYHWEQVEPFWLALCRAKIKPIMIVTYNNPIYAAGIFRAVIGPLNIRAYQNFAVAMAKHFASACPGMAEELFNEPSASNWTGGVEWSGASYAAMLAPVSAAIKAAEPRVAVYSGGIGLDPHAPSDWITQMARAKRFPAVDAYGLHPYYDNVSQTAAPLPEQILIDGSRFAKDAASGGEAKPVAITEYGIPLRLVGADLTRQAIFVARGMLAAIIGKYPLHTHYDLIDDGTDTTDDQNTFGLFRNAAYKVPFEIKPAGRAYRAITQAMSGAKAYRVAFDEEHAIPSVTFETMSGETSVIWTYDAGTPKHYASRIGAFRQVACKDLFGKTYPCSYASETLDMTLTEAAGPVIVTATR